MNSFLQSNEWLELQKAIGRKAWQIDSFNVIKHNLPFKKSYLYVPRCGGNFLSEQFLNKIKEIAKKEQAIFLKVEPLDFARGNSIELGKFGFKKSHNIQPKQTIILDITRSEQELLSQMHYKTRYNIQLAQKKNIEIKNGTKYFEGFWWLIEKTSRRDKFRPHPKKYYQKMLEIPGAELFTALIPSSTGRAMTKVIAANIVVFYEKTCIYLHGASDYEQRNLMAPYLLQWEQIKEAKKRGCTEYDFWGIDEKKWPGVTRFKKGFGGQEISYPGAYDLVFRPIWYWIYKIARRIL